MELVLFLIGFTFIGVISGAYSYIQYSRMMHEYHMKWLVQQKGWIVTAGLK